MTRTIYYTATTLDGYLADENHSLEWLFKQDQDDEGPMNYSRFIKGVGAVVMGSATYEWILRHHMKEGIRWPYHQPCWVMTSRVLPEIHGANVQFAEGSVSDLHPTLAEAASGKDIWVVGGGDLAGQFADAEILDEIILNIAPVTLGAGAMLLPRRLNLQLVEVAQNRAFICAHYKIAGSLDRD